ncbi:MAG TPA: tripartite tricarboxylate transporter substrate binding protein [Candidatus Limnocylindrales bacterium]|nr:tripartite tricarboxylate transporter substrate binding protein [Candidatus Limnocylindrales bacterium]
MRVVVAFPPGGIVDNVARQIQPRLSAALSQPVIIDNRSGAGGTVGAAEVAKAAPDGHTLLMVFDSYATYPLVYPKLNFDIAKDLQPVTQIASNPLILVVNPKVEAKDFKGFVSLIRSQPGRYNYASVGPGSSNHLTAELFKAVSGTFITHIPYRGGGPAQQDLLGGQVEMMFLSAVLAQPHVKAGKLRALAQTGAQRVSAYADTPTVAESGYRGFEVNSWVGMLAPAGTPRPVVDRLQAEVRKIVTEPAFAARLQEQGLAGIANTPEQFAAALRVEQDKWTRLGRERQRSLE